MEPGQGAAVGHEADACGAGHAGPRVAGDLREGEALTGHVDSASRRSASISSASLGRAALSTSAAVDGDQHVVLDANPAKLSIGAEQLIDAVPVHLFAVTPAALRIGEQCRDEIDARLDGDDITRLER